MDVVNTKVQCFFAILDSGADQKVWAELSQ